MRLWHYRLLPYLPDAQFRGQLRELVAIMRDWRDKGKTNHLLINKVTEYSKEHLAEYFMVYSAVYFMRYGKNIKSEYVQEFNSFSPDHLPPRAPIFPEWHNETYLNICMANLFEKHRFGSGKSRITEEEWEYLCEGYETITRKRFRME